MKWHVGLCIINTNDNINTSIVLPNINKCNRKSKYRMEDIDEIGSRTRTHAHTHTAEQEKEEKMVS